MIFLVFAVLFGAALSATGEFTARHSLFLLGAAALLVFGESFHDDRAAYWRSLLFLAGAAAAVFVAHYMTPLQIRFWEVASYAAFAVSVAGLILIPMPFFSSRTTRFVLGLIASLIYLALPVTFFGHLMAEGGWPNADSVVAILQSNPAEIASYLTDALDLWRCFLLVFSLLFLSLISAVLATGLSARELSRTGAVMLLVFVAASAAMAFRTRENILTIPIYEARGYMRRVEEFRAAKDEMRSVPLSFSSRGDAGLYVLVIGEAATRDHMSAYGYGRETTPWMDSVRGKEGFLLFENAYASYVTTVRSLSYALTAENQYSSKAAAPTLIATLNSAGYDTAWLSNQIKYGLYDTPVTVMASEAKEVVWINSHIGEGSLTDFYDEALVERLIKLGRTGKRFVVLHLMGSHNSYQDRFPKEFSRFSGDNIRVDDYDGSILYTDYVLKRIYEAASAMPDFRAMVYFSDHGEGVDYGHRHSTANFSWPMARIPLFMAFSQRYVAEHRASYDRLRARQGAYFTNDLVYDLMLGIMGVRVDGFYDAKNDMVSDEYDMNPARFTTLYGQRYVTEDTTGK